MKHLGMLKSKLKKEPVYTLSVKYLKLALGGEEYTKLVSKYQQAKLRAYERIYKQELGNKKVNKHK